MYEDEPVLLPALTLGEWISLPSVIDGRVYSRRMLTSTVFVGSIFNQQPNLGGWRLSIHHQYDQVRRVLYLGDGSAFNAGLTEKSNGEKWIVSADRSEIFVFDSNIRHVRTISSKTAAIKYSFHYNQDELLTSIVDKYGKQTTIQYDGSRVLSVTSPFGHVSHFQTDSNGYISSVTDPGQNTHSMTYSSLGLLLSFTDPNGISSTMIYDEKGRLLSDLSNAGSAIYLAANQNFNSKTVIQNSALQRKRTLTMNTSLNNYDRQVTHANGSSESYYYDKTVGSTFLYTGESYNRSYTKTLDNRLGGFMPSATTILDGYQSSLTYYGETVNLNDPNDPFSFSTFVKTWNVNNKIYKSTYTPSNSTEIYRTPLGRNVTSIFNSNDDVTVVQFADFLPWQFSFDPLGRVNALSQGDRSTTMTYNSSGFLETITNALAEKTTFNYDLAGRVKSQRLPDNRLIKFSYDANGNVTGITPPWKTTHQMNYNGFNLLDTYLPPTIEAPNSNTSYAYNNDRELIQINRPDGQAIEFNHNGTTGNLDSIDLPNGTRYFNYSYGIMNYSTSEDNVSKNYVFSGTKVISDTFTNDSRTFSVNNTFNNDHNLSIETLLSGPTNWPISFGYDDDTLLTSAGNQTYLRDIVTGLLNQMTLESVQQYLTYSPEFGELLSLETSFASTNLYKETMTRDKLGRIKTASEQYGTEAQKNSEFTYDKAGRLTAVSVNGQPHSNYTYDSNNNRMSQTINGYSLNAAFSPMSISIGDEHSCSLTSSGVKCWGEASSGAVGYRNLRDIGDNELLTAVNFVRLGLTIKSISSGNRHNCVQFINNNVRCWGENTQGQLGLGHTTNIGDNEHPSTQPYLNLGDKALILASGGSHNCILKPQNKVSCWGLGSSGQLGYGNTNNIGDDEHPATVGDVPTGSNSRIVQLVAGDSHTCLMATNGRFKCWGSNSHRQLGFGTTGTNIGDDETPDANVYLNFGELITQISAGGDHTCVVTETNKLKCWGRNDYGQLGLGNTTVLTTTPRLHPYVDVGEDVKSVSAGRNSTCVITVTDKVKCWGLNDAGQLGQGNLATIGDDEHPSTISSIDFGTSPVISVKIGDQHACAMLADKNVICWGSGASGRLALGNIDNIGDNELPNSVGFIQGLKQDGIKYDDQDRLLAFGTKTFIYNANGDLLSDVNSESGITRTFEYDVFGNLKKVLLPNKTISYKVDVHNRRVAKYEDSVLVQYYIWNSRNQLVGLADSSGILTTRFVYGSKTHSPDYMIKDNIHYQMISNHLGSPVVVVNSSSGVVAQKITYDEFGNILLDSNPGFTPIGFAGCLYEVDTGLCRFGARDYDPSIGRWLSKDPILFAAGDANLYGYVFQDPINHIDPSGLMCSYSQSSGQMTCTNTNGQIYYSANGYSGSNGNGGRNNFFQQGTQSTGPIPLGTYTVGAPYSSPNTGPNTMVITPNMQTSTSIQSSGRDPGSFRIHGNNSSNNASQGCIILPANRTNIPPGETVNVGL